MAIVGIEEFLYEKTGPIFDVRSPCEFARGHIPGAISFPLFTDEERARVGTTYKQNGHDAAVLIGLDIVGPKLVQMAETFQRHMRHASEESCRLLCYRGGMRSASMQWLSEFIRIPCVRLATGYKGYRTYVCGLLEKKYNFIGVGGRTGSGKTAFLRNLRDLGYQTIDLEEIANHRGSAFGLLPKQHQPTIEQFENRIAQVLSSFNWSKPIFIEDESRSIGTCVIPKGIYDQMRACPLIWLDVNAAVRLERILAQYGSLPVPWLVECAERLVKRLGGERISLVCEYIKNGLLKEAARDLMLYYDATYDYGLHAKVRMTHVATEENFLSVAASLALEI